MYGCLAKHIRKQSLSLLIKTVEANFSSSMAFTSAVAQKATSVISSQCQCEIPCPYAAEALHEGL